MNIWGKKRCSKPPRKNTLDYVYVSCTAEAAMTLFAGAISKLRKISEGKDSPFFVIKVVYLETVKSFIG